MDREVHTRGFGGGRDFIERGHLEVLDVDGRIILKSVFKKYNWVWTGLI